MWFKHASKLGLLATCSIVAGCIMGNPPSLLQSANLNGAPATIAGPILDQCKVKTGFGGSAIVAQTATFSPGLTLSLGRLIYIRGGGDRVAGLKIYELSYNAANLFGFRSDGTVACLYVQEAGSLRFLDELRLDSNGQAMISSRDAMVGRVGRAISR